MILPAMLEAIMGGRETANFEAFLFHSGQVATEFCDALAERARRRAMQEVFERDLLRSRRYTLEDFEKRSL
jgi:hypothetical protein